MPLRHVKDYLRRRQLARAGIAVEIDLPVFRAGARSGVWAVYPETLTPQSRVYSFGVGDNIAWDLALIDTFGVTVHAFDPTPASVAWVGQQHLPHSFRFHPLGLAAHDGVARFQPPARPGSCNCTPCPTGTIVVPVRRLGTILAEMGQDGVDVLKLDIEGGEYEVIADLLGGDFRPGQILVEFHHNLPGIPFTRTREAVTALRSAGYRVFDISRRGLEFSFLLDANPLRVYR